MKITDSIKYVGVNDHKIDLFEGQYNVPNGMSYNSYVILDKKIAVMDSVDKNFGDQWISNIKSILQDKSPDFLVVHHMESDHSANITLFAQTFPNAKIVSSSKAFEMMKNFFGNNFEDRQVIISEGDTLDLGNHKLTFYAAPMVHWPEVMVSYDSYEKILFSADGFGKFGALDIEEEWACEARRYYIGIVGKYGVQVQALLKKAATLDIQKICPLHGPILTENLSYYINLYDIWSKYEVETPGIVIAYNSIYGNTKAAVELLASELTKNGCNKVVVNDLARCDMHEAIEDAFRYGTLVLASPTYNGSIFPYMKTFISHLTERNFQNRKLAFIENGSWAPIAAKIMKTSFEKSKNICYAQTTVTIKSGLNDDSIQMIKTLAKELSK